MHNSDDRTGFRTYTRAIDALERIVDPAFLERVFRHAHVRLVPPPEHYALPQSWREVRLHIDPADYYAGYLGVRDEIEIPMQLCSDLRERVPQAMLRDIHRVEFLVDEPVEWETRELGIDPGGREALKEARAALTREALPVIEPLVEAVMAEQERRRRFLAEPWQPTIPDDFPRNYREIFD